MNKGKLLKIVNPALFVLFIIQSITGLIFFFKLRVPDPGTIARLHKYAGIGLIIAVICHIILNWDWIRTAFFKKR